VRGPQGFWAAGAKRATGAGEDDGTYFIIEGQCGKRIGETFIHLGGQGVEFVGAVGCVGLGAGETHETRANHRGYL
jgi:hypothetical protein